MEWMEFEQQEPFGDRRRDWQAASICTTIANMTAIGMRSETRFKVSDFMLDFSAVPKQPEQAPGKSWQEMKMIAQMMAAASQTDARRKRR
jgi:hypothetical protein